MAIRIRLEQIERGRVLRELINWYESGQRNFARRFDDLRRRSQRAAARAKLGPKDIDRLIREARTHRAKA